MTLLATLIWMVILWALVAWLLEKPAFMYTLVALCIGAGVWIWLAHHA